MTKIEKVRKGLECCALEICPGEECPYVPATYEDECVSVLCADALELLKELYQARIQELQKRINQLELELQYNQNWENYQKGLYNFQTYYTNLLSEISSIP